MLKKLQHHISQNQFDLILFEQGSFSPLNWLLREGHLDYNDYQNWRNDKSGYLEDYFKKPTAEIIILLIEIQSHADSLQLKSIKQRYVSFASQPLHFCRSSENEDLFTIIYKPDENRIQKDLFFDSAPACAEFNLKKAINDERSEDIADLLVTLKTFDLEKHQKFAQLISFEKNIIQSKENSDKKIKALQKLTPLVFETLGRFADDFLTPLWQKISIEITNRQFNPETPDYHISYTAFKAFQWQQVLLSIEQEKYWNKQPTLLFRYAEACFKLNKEHCGITSWFTLFIQFSEIAEKLISNTSNQLLHSDWLYFCELEPELEPLLFLAWMVIKKPALIKSTVITHNNEALQLIIKLVSNIDAEITPSIIHLRKKLQQNHPTLFTHYMNSAIIASGCD